jgi:hypothetical protein
VEVSFFEESRWKNMRKAMERDHMEQEKWACAAWISSFPKHALQILQGSISFMLIYIYIHIYIYFHDFSLIFSTVFVSIFRFFLPSWLRFHPLQSHGVCPGRFVSMGLCGICCFGWELQHCFQCVDVMGHWQVHMVLYHLAGDD